MKQAIACALGFWLSSADCTAIAGDEATLAASRADGREVLWSSSLRVDIGGLPDCGHWCTYEAETTVRFAGAREPHRGTHTLHRSNNEALRLHVELKTGSTTEAELAQPVSLEVGLYRLPTDPPAARGRERVALAEVALDNSTGDSWREPSAREPGLTHLNQVVYLRLDAKPGTLHVQKAPNPSVIESLTYRFAIKALPAGFKRGEVSYKLSSADGKIIDARKVYLLKHDHRKRGLNFDIRVHQPSAIPDHIDYELLEDGKPKVTGTLKLEEFPQRSGWDRNRLDATLSVDFTDATKSRVFYQPYAR
jgi:hypothetical protein